MSFFLLLYNIALVLGLTLSFPVWLTYLLVSPKARNGFFKKLGWYSTNTKAHFDAVKDRPRIWFHAVSVGELNAIRPLIDTLMGDYAVFISTTTKTAQSLARSVYPDLGVFYFPFDFRPVIHQTLNRLKPDLVVLTETELWPNFIDCVRRNADIPMMMINGRLSKSSYKGYQIIQPLIQDCLQQLSHLYMQAQGDADRIRQLGDLPADHLTVVGNLKFDIQPVVDPMQRNILSHLLGFGPHDTVLVFASTHSGEDGPLLDVYAALKKDFPELKLILAPRHPERRDEIRGILSSKALRYALRSHLSEESPNREDIVILDSIGELVATYAISAIAVLGGSFVEKGGQNPLEPLSQRLPVIFGPDMSNFTEISQMIVEQHAGYQAKSVAEVADLITLLLTEPENRNTLVENGQQLLENNRGAKEILSIAIRHQLHDATAPGYIEPG